LQSIDKVVQNLAPLVEIVLKRVTRGAPVVDTAVKKETQGLKRGRQRTPAAHCAKAIKKEKENVPAIGQYNKPFFILILISTQIPVLSLDKDGQTPTGKVHKRVTVGAPTPDVSKVKRSRMRPPVARGAKAMKK
jgi:hypothetical protein